MRSIEVIIIEKREKGLIKCNERRYVCFKVQRTGKFISGSFEVNHGHSHRKKVKMNLFEVI